MPAKIDFQNLDSSARYGYRTIGSQVYPEIQDILEALAAAAKLCGVSFDAEGLPVIDEERAAAINPGGRLCRIIIDVRS